MPISSRIFVNNRTAVPRVVAVEPWAEDYTLFSGEELEIIAYSDSGIPYFHLVEWDDSTQVYCEGADLFKVMQSGVELECGHNRQDSTLRPASK